MTNSTDATFAFSSDSLDPSLTFACDVDGGGFQACTSPALFPGFTEGNHTFSVQATDASGTDSTPATYSWTVDTTPPETTLPSNLPDLTNSTQAFFEFTSSEANSTFQCQLDGAGFQACSSPALYSGLADGSHTFSVRAIDQAGNIDPDLTTSTWTWTVDTTAPETTIDSGPGPTNSTSAAFGFSSLDDLDATFECQLDGGAFQACTSPQLYTDLSGGPHVFSVRAVDLAGNADPSPASTSFTVVLAAAASPASVSQSTVTARPAASFVLIAGRTVKVRHRKVTVALNCSGNKDCSGRVVLSTAKMVRYHHRVRIVRFGSTHFEIPAPKTVKVTIRLSRAKYRLLRHMKVVKALVTVTDVDRAGRARLGTREITLRA